MTIGEKTRGNLFRWLAIAGLLLALAVITPPTAWATHDEDAPHPNAPTNLVVEVGDKEMKVSWTASADHEDCEVIGYLTGLSRIDRDERNGDTYVSIVRATSAGTTHTFGELAADTEYHVGVGAFSHDCWVFSNTLSGVYRTNAEDSTDDPTVPAAKTGPDAPTGVTISKDGVDDIAVSWTAPATSATKCAVSWYDFRFSRGGVTWQNDHDTTETSHTFEDEYVAGDQYTAIVYSFSWECNKWSSEARQEITLD